MKGRVAIASVTRVDTRRTSADAPARHDQDLVAAEAPLLLVVRSHDGAQTRSAGLLMRTPGDDRELVLGLLYAEGVIRRRQDVLTIVSRQPSAVGSDEPETVEATLAADIALSSLTTDRVFTGNSACGLCGRLAVEALDRRPAGARTLEVPAATISTLPASLLQHQTAFAETGGLHAAGFFAPDGALISVREDVGRHNAVDKLIGAALEEDALPAANRILVVSGRVAFEIVQKAAAAGVGMLVAVGAPSSLAVDAARAAQLTLVGFARNSRFNIYSCPEKILR